MKSKLKVKSTLIRTDTVTENGARYVYSLTQRESQSVASYRIPLYSVHIELTDREGNRTEASVNDAFSDVGRAIVFYDRLREHLATPINLPYIFEDEKV